MSAVPQEISDLLYDDEAPMALYALTTPTRTLLEAYLFSIALCEGFWIGPNQNQEDWLREWMNDDLIANMVDRGDIRGLVNQLQIALTDCDTYTAEHVYHASCSNGVWSWDNNNQPASKHHHKQFRVPRPLNTHSDFETCSMDDWSFVDAFVTMNAFDTFALHQPPLEPAQAIPESDTVQNESMVIGMYRDTSIMQVTLDPMAYIDDTILHPALNHHHHHHVDATVPTNLKCMRSNVHSEWRKRNKEASTRNGLWREWSDRVLAPRINYVSPTTRSTIDYPYLTLLLRTHHNLPQEFNEPNEGLDQEKKNEDGRERDHDVEDEEEPTKRRSSARLSRRRAGYKSPSAYFRTGSDVGAERLMARSYDKLRTIKIP